MRLLTDAAERSDSPGLKAFKLDEDERYAVHIAAWLYDCGKVTRPDHVVDKATKLETKYNRIHEIRTRFEVLRHDADIAYLKGLIKGGNAEQLPKKRLDRYTELSQQFELIAHANIGDLPLKPETALGIAEIVKHTWVRNFDRRSGFSQVELNRLEEVVGIPA